MSAAGREAMGATEGLSVQWGVRPSSALWPVTVRILFVLDGRIDTSHGSGCFGLGYVPTARIRRIRGGSGSGVDVVRRDRGELRLCSQGDVNPLAPGDQVEFDVLDFKFTEPKFSLDDYDQVWFFGDYPANSDQPIDDPSFRSLCDDELRLLADVDGSRAVASSPPATISTSVQDVPACPTRTNDAPESGPKHKGHRPWMARTTRDAPTRRRWLRRRVGRGHDATDDRARPAGAGQLDRVAPLGRSSVVVRASTASSTHFSLTICTRGR